MMSERTVCIVDDDKAVRASLGALLRTAGFGVQTYGSGPEFLEAPNSLRCGCAVLDVRMPGMSGLQLQAMLAQREIKIPIIMITGHADIPMAVAAMQAGAMDFIEKPFRDETIIRSIQRAFEEPVECSGEELSASATRKRIESLSEREYSVFIGVVAGKPNKIIAHELGISPRTVEVHRAKVMSKLEARNLADLVRLAMVMRILNGKRTKL